MNQLHGTNFMALQNKIQHKIKLYPKVLFICAGSTSVGLGHVIRTKNVATVFSLKGTVHVIIIGDKTVVKLLYGASFSFNIIPNTDKINKLIENYNPDIVVFDLIKFPKKIFRKLNRKSITVSISPIFNCLSEVNLFFNRTVYNKFNNINKINKKIKIFNGLKYTILRENCTKISYNEYARDLKINPLPIAISMGGCDANNKTLEVLSSLKKISPSVVFWVMLGEGYDHSFQSLIDSVACDSPHEIILAKTNDSMWRVLRMCKIVILAGGITTYEAAYAGLPSINILESKDKIFLIKELEEKGVCINAGYSFKDALKNIKTEIDYLYNNRSKLLDMHIRSKKLIDEKGAWRIYKEINNLYQYQKSNI
jgi:spore coat polysaccharide biosynthesis predicted glycosyltransferase SpsG